MSAANTVADSDRVAYSISEAAAAVGMSRAVISAAINGNYPHPLPAYHVGAKGGARRVLRSDLIAWLKAHPEGGMP